MPLIDHEINNMMDDTKHFESHKGNYIVHIILLTRAHSNILCVFNLICNFITTMQLFVSSHFEFYFLDGSTVLALLLSAECVFHFFVHDLEVEYVVL